MTPPTPLAGPDRHLYDVPTDGAHVVAVATWRPAEVHVRRVAPAR